MIKLIKHCKGLFFLQLFVGYLVILSFFPDHMCFCLIHRCSRDNCWYISSCKPWGIWYTQSVSTKLFTDGYVTYIWNSRLYM